MKVVALVSGGKDSCFNMMQCQTFGHEIVALANLLPAEAGVDELDSFMFQTVGHQLVAAYAECTGLPLFRRHIKGSSRNTDMRYAPTVEDEVEDLVALLEHVKRAMPGVEAVSSGAIASDYQRLRVESVCSRLGLVSLAYLWKQPQDQLLQDMIDSGIHAVLVKVAALGLKPEVHLGQSLQQMQGTLRSLASRFGVNVCGEGGEYETLTLDCPLFTRGRIVLDTWHMVEVSADPGGAPVAHMSVDAFHVERKETSGAKGESGDPPSLTPPSSKASPPMKENGSAEGEPSSSSSKSTRGVPSHCTFTQTILVDDPAPLVPGLGPPRVPQGQPGSSGSGTHSTRSNTEERGSPGPHPVVDVCSRPSGNGLMLLRCRGPAPVTAEQYGIPGAHQATSSAGQTGEVAAHGPGMPGVYREVSPEDLTGEAVGGMLRAVGGVLKAQGLSWNSALYIRLYLADMAHFGCANRAYSAAIPEAQCPLGVPSRATVEVPAVTVNDSRSPHSDGLGDASAGGAGGRRTVDGAMLDVLVAREVAEGDASLEGALRDAEGVPGGVCSEADDRRLASRWAAGEAVKSVLHVKSISSWAPSCIGPYSQCTRYRNLLFMAGQLGLDPPTMELVTPTPHPHAHKRPSGHTAGTPAPAGTLTAFGTPGGTGDGVPRMREAASAAVAEARRALASCQAVSEAMGASCGAHSLSMHVYCGPGVGGAERQGLWAELSAFFRTQGKSAGAPPDSHVGSCGSGEGGGGEGEGGGGGGEGGGGGGEGGGGEGEGGGGEGGGGSGGRVCGSEGPEEEEDEEVDELRGLRGRFRGMWAPESSGEATGVPGFSIAPALVFLSVPALPKGAAVEVVPVVYVPSTTASSELPEGVPKALQVTDSGAVLCSGHAIPGRLCSAHLFFPLEEQRVGESGSVGVSAAGQELDGGLEACVAAALVPRLRGALEASGLTWDDVAELRVHYDAKSIRGELLEAMLEKELGEGCESTVLPLFVPVSAIHVARRGSLAPVAVHAQMLALCYSAEGRIYYGHK